MILDVDDLFEGHDRMDLLLRLKEVNPGLKVSAFAIPRKCSWEYLDSLPDWVEVIPHGLDHGDPPVDGGEWKDWPYDHMIQFIDMIEDDHPRWQHGAKAPGWQISTEAMRALADRSWFLADQPYNRDRRPDGLRVHLLGDGDHVHCHVQNVCGNGLEETFPYLLERVAAAESFEWVSEAVVPWCAAVAA